MRLKDSEGKTLNSISELVDNTSGVSDSETITNWEEEKLFTVSSSESKKVRVENSEGKMVKGDWIDSISDLEVSDKNSGVWKSELVRIGKVMLSGCLNSELKKMKIEDSEGKIVSRDFDSNIPVEENVNSDEKTGGIIKLEE